MDVRMHRTKIAKIVARIFKVETLRSKDVNGEKIYF